MDRVNGVIITGRNGKVTRKDGTKLRPKLSRVDIKPRSFKAGTQGTRWQAVNSNVLGSHPDIPIIAGHAAPLELTLVASVSCISSTLGFPTVTWASASQLHAQPSYLTLLHITWPQRLFSEPLAQTSRSCNFFIQRVCENSLTWRMPSSSASLRDSQPS